MAQFDISLLGLYSTIVTAKEVELTVLFLLIHWQSSVDTQQQLGQLEGIAL
jgi:hypothetical protein